MNITDVTKPEISILNNTAFTVVHSLFYVRCTDPGNVQHSRNM